MAPVAVPVLALLELYISLHVAQRRAAEAVLHAGFHGQACLCTVWPVGFLMEMVVVVIVVGSSAGVVDVLASVHLVQRQLSRLGLVGVVVAVVLWVDYQWPIQVGLHITTAFPWVGHLHWDNRVSNGMSGCLQLKGSEGSDHPDYSLTPGIYCSCKASLQ